MKLMKLYAHRFRGHLCRGEWYKDFTQTTDEEVKALLNRAAEKQFT